MASREKATSRQTTSRISGSGIYDQTEHIGGDGQTNKDDEYLDDMKQDDEIVLPIDLSITPVAPPGERNYSVSVKMDLRVAVYSYRLQSNELTQ